MSRNESEVIFYALLVENCTLYSSSETKLATTVVPALCDPRRERPPALYGHVINAPTDTFQR